MSDKWQGTSDQSRVMDSRIQNEKEPLVGLESCNESEATPLLALIEELRKMLNALRRKLVTSH
jgi:hypothetical protein